MNDRILAIDPGNEASAYVLADAETYRPIEGEKVDNDQLLERIVKAVRDDGIREIAIEMVESFGMPVGMTVFETCVWIGRFTQTAITAAPGEAMAWRIQRGKVKRHLCMSRAAKDSNVIQALVDRFAPGAQNHGKGTKKDPGWFYGFKADVWQAYALAVTFIDLQKGRSGTNGK